MLRFAIVCSASMIALPAVAMGRIASDGRATLSELEIDVRADAWTIRARLDGSARRVALIVPLPDASTAAVIGPAALDELDYRTSPRLRIVDAFDPCTKPEKPNLDERWPKRSSVAPSAFTAKVIAPLEREQLEAELAGLSLDAESQIALVRAVSDGARLVILSGPAPGKLRGWWTPPIEIATKSRSLALGFAALHITTGRDLRVEIYTHGLAPQEKTTDLPSEIYLPEVSAEDPLELYRAITTQTIRREGRGTIVRIASDRWYLELGRQDERRTVALAASSQRPFSAVWWIRKLWRRPIGCAVKERYQNNARIQQKTEIQTYAAVTGRPQSLIESRMKERGLLIE